MGDLDIFRLTRIFRYHSNTHDTMVRYDGKDEFGNPVFVHMMDINGNFDAGHIEVDEEGDYIAMRTGDYTMDRIRAFSQMTPRHPFLLPERWWEPEGKKNISFNAARRYNLHVAPLLRGITREDVKESKRIQSELKHFHQCLQNSPSLKTLNIPYEICELIFSFIPLYYFKGVTKEDLLENGPDHIPIEDVRFLEHDATGYLVSYNQMNRRNRYRHFTVLDDSSKLFQQEQKNLMMLMLCLYRRGLDEKTRMHLLSFLKRVDFEPRLQRFIGYECHAHYGDFDTDDEV